MKTSKFLERLLSGNGVVWKPLTELTTPTKNIKWRETKRTYRYIDLTSVDVESKKINQTKKISSDTAPSRAQKIVLQDDILFATTRPAQLRYCLVDSGYSGEVASTGYCVLRANKSEVLPRWILHWLGSRDFKEYVKQHQTGAAYPAISDEKVREFKIPVPCPEDPKKSLAIQTEIVRVLDELTLLSTSLIAELNREQSVRVKKYTYHREKLLSFEGTEVDWKPLSEIVTTLTSPTRLKRNSYELEGAIPIIDQGSSFIAGYTNASREALEDGEYILFGDHTENVKYADFSFVQGADGLKIMKPIRDNAKFIYYCLETYYQKDLGYKRHWSKAKDTLIPIPYAKNPEQSSAAQTAVVNILDRLTSLRDALLVELPREIELRQQQYAYYRDLLLSFPKPEELAA